MTHVTCALVASSAIACASTPAPSAPVAAPSAPTVTPSATSDVASASKPTVTTVSAAEHFAIDVTEHGALVAMPALFDATSPKSSFPAASAGDRECWQGTILRGDHARDYAAIVARCGAPTGAREYAKPVTGRLHHAHDKRDTYRIKLAGGLCYRYFAVADGTVSDLDILIETTGGALVGDDRTKQPVAIIEPDKPWCIDDDREYDFHIEVDGTGEGFYTFGVWARPKR